MTRIIYVNGLYQPYAQAKVHAEDRGLLFADGVYEVCEIRDGVLVDEELHMKRLQRSLRELKMQAPMSMKALGIMMREVRRRNKVVHGMIYLQVTRGAAYRNFIFPSEDVPPSVICFARSVAGEQADKSAAKGIAVWTMPDIRWQRPDIKSTSLLPNALARQEAFEHGASEAWLIDADGYVTEGAASNAWILTNDNVLRTRPAQSGILRGVTRHVVMELCEAENIQYEEKPFSVEEALQAKEAFITAATNIVMPVVKINDQKIGNGQPGDIAKTLRKLFHSYAKLAK